jgi:hypothetical protein
VSVLGGGGGNRTGVFGGGGGYRTCLYQPRVVVAELVAVRLPHKHTHTDTDTHTHTDTHTVPAHI